MPTDYHQLADLIMQRVSRVERSLASRNYAQAKNFMNTTLTDVHFDLIAQNFEHHLHSGRGFVGAVRELKKAIDSRSDRTPFYIKALRAYYAQTKLPLEEETF